MAWSGKIEDRSQPMFARNPVDEDNADARRRRSGYISDEQQLPLICSDVYESLDA